MVVAYGVVTVVTVSALVVSAYYLWRLARQAGMPLELAWTLPVALDAGAAGATVCWVTAAAAARSWGRGIALVALGGTVGGNMLSHLIEFGLLPVTPTLVIGIGAVYPAVVWAMVHLALVLRAEQRDVSEAMVDAATIRAAAARDAERVRQTGTDDAGRLLTQARHDVGQLLTQARHDADVVRTAAQESAQQLRHDAARDAQLMRQQAADDVRESASVTELKQHRKPAQSRRHDIASKSTAEQRQAWIERRLDAGVDVTPADVRAQFSDASNAWRDLASVKARRDVIDVDDVEREA